MAGHPLYKLGKGKAETDIRTMSWGDIVKSKVAVPTEYDFDVANSKLGRVPLPMFANDRYGCCVISGRAHQTLRFELLEQKSKISISDKEIITQYMKETGGRDTGLVVLRSLKAWQQGWVAAGKTYKIRAYAGIKTATQGSSSAVFRRQVQEAVFLNQGVGVGISLPLSASDQIDRGQAWDVVSGRRGRAGSWGGHYVYVVGYNKTGPICVTWARKQQMTWAFWDAYCDECYVVFDALNTSKVKKALNVKGIEEFLLNLDAIPVNVKKLPARKKVAKKNGDDATFGRRKAAKVKAKSRFKKKKC